MQNHEALRILQENSVIIDSSDTASPPEIVERLGLNPATEEVYRTAFSQAVNAFMEDLGISSTDFCEYFDVSVVTLVGYRQAIAMPQPAAARYMLERMQQIKQEHLISKVTGLGRAAVGAELE